MQNQTARPGAGQRAGDQRLGLNPKKLAGDANILVRPGLVPDLGQVIDLPDLRVVVNARDVLIGTDLVDRERRAVAEKLARRRQVFPERHFDFATTARRDGVELRGRFHDAALAELSQFRRALDGLFFKL